LLCIAPNSAGSNIELRLWVLHLGRGLKASAPNAQVYLGRRQSLLVVRVERRPPISLQRFCLLQSCFFLCFSDCCFCFLVKSNFVEPLFLVL